VVGARPALDLGHRVQAGADALGVVRAGAVVAADELAAVPADLWWVGLGWGGVGVGSSWVGLGDGVVVK